MNHRLPHEGEPALALWQDGCDFPGCFFGTTYFRPYQGTPAMTSRFSTPMPFCDGCRAGVHRRKIFHQISFAVEVNLAKVEAANLQTAPVQNFKAVRGRGLEIIIPVRS